MHAYQVELETILILEESVFVGEYVRMKLTEAAGRCCS